MRYCLECNRAFSGNGWTCPNCGFTPRQIEGFPCFSPQSQNQTEDYDPNYYPLLAGIEEDSFWFASRNRLVVWAMTRFLGHARNVLDLGVGTGF